MSDREQFEKSHAKAIALNKRRHGAWKQTAGKKLHPDLVRVREGQHLSVKTKEEHRLHKTYPGLFESIARGGTQHNK